MIQIHAISFCQKYISPRSKKEVLRFTPQMCEGLRTLGFRKEIDCFTMPAVYTRARRQMCHLKTKHSNPYPSISLKWMCRLCFWGERSQRQRVIIIQIDIMKKYVCYICINMQIYYDIFIYIFIRNFAYICVIHYLPPTLSQYLFPIKFQPPSTHTPSSRNQGRP